MKHPTRTPARQRGAALVVGLMLLLILTLLAVAGMNTASTELAMAGNEQYRQNAFQASEAGIEQALPRLWVDVPTDGSTVSATATVPASTDQYTTASRYIGASTTAPPGFSATGYGAFQYEIQSTGTSARNASASNAQGAFVVQNTGS